MQEITLVRCQQDGCGSPIEVKSIYTPIICQPCRMELRSIRRQRNMTGRYRYSCGHEADFPEMDIQADNPCWDCARAEQRGVAEIPFGEMTLEGQVRKLREHAAKTCPTCRNGTKEHLTPEEEQQWFNWAVRNLESGPWKNNIALCCVERMRDEGFVVTDGDSQGE